MMQAGGSNERDELNESPEVGDEVYGQEPPEIDDDAPRRAASARFIVDSQAGSDAAMREAMDPANQSLADALRLSFRVLQAVILVLVVLFLVSGFQTVDEGQSGVRTVWGKIEQSDGVEALVPGPQFSIFPYPIGEFILFQDENRALDLGDAFAPFSRGLTREQMLEGASTSAPLTPGRDGSLLTRDGDLAHLELSAKYGIDHAGAFVRRVNDSSASRGADRIVTLALQQAANHVAATSSLQELIEQTDEVRARIQQKAQATLDGLKCGIQIRQVQVKAAYAPLAIEKALGDLQAARVDSAQAIEKARQRANETLNQMSGKDFPALIQLIDQYQDAVERGDEAQQHILASINQKLDENDGGEVSKIIQSARSYQSQIESTLGNEYRRFASLLPAYKSNPRLMVRQQWLDAFSQVIERPDAEIFYVDPHMAMRLSLSGSAAIQNLRREDELARMEQEANQQGANRLSPYIMRAGDINTSGPGRQLQIGGSKPAPLPGH